MNVSFLFNILNCCYTSVFVMEEQCATNVFGLKTDRGGKILLKCRKTLIFSESVA